VAAQVATGARYAAAASPGGVGTGPLVPQQHTAARTQRPAVAPGSARRPFQFSTSLQRSNGSGTGTDTTTLPTSGVSRFAIASLLPVAANATGSSARGLCSTAPASGVTPIRPHHEPAGTRGDVGGMASQITGLDLVLADRTIVARPRLPRAARTHAKHPSR
jgi:hypothetical protein